MGPFFPLLNIIPTLVHDIHLRFFCCLMIPGIIQIYLWLISLLILVTLNITCVLNSLCSCRKSWLQLPIRWMARTQDDSAPGSTSNPVDSDPGPSSAATSSALQRQETAIASCFHPGARFSTPKCATCPWSRGLLHQPRHFSHSWCPQLLHVWLIHWQSIDSCTGHGSAYTPGRNYSKMVQFVTVTLLFVENLMISLLCYLFLIGRLPWKLNFLLLFITILGICSLHNLIGT
jgi:hypothetical protein